MFVFVLVMYVCSYEIDQNFCENSKSFAGLAEEAPRGGTKPEIADHFSNIGAYYIVEAIVHFSNPRGSLLLSRGPHLFSRGLHPELYDFAPSGLLNDWSDPVLSRGLHPELYDFAPSGLLHDWSNPVLSRGLHPELYDFAPSGLLNDWSNPRVRPLEMTCRPMGRKYMTNDREVDEAVIITEYHDAAEVTRSSAAVVPTACRRCRGRRLFRQGEELAKRARSLLLFSRFFPLVETAIENRQRYGALAFMATELGSGSSRGEKRQKVKVKGKSIAAAVVAALSNCRHRAGSLRMLKAARRRSAILPTFGNSTDIS